MAPLPMPAYALASRAAVEAPNKPALTVCRDVLSLMERYDGFIVTTIFCFMRKNQSFI